MLSYESDTVKSRMHVTLFTNSSASVFLPKELRHRSIQSRVLSCTVCKSSDLEIINRNFLYFSHVEERRLTSQFFFKTVQFLFLRAMSENLDLFFWNLLHQSYLVLLNMWKQPILSLEKRKIHWTSIGYLSSNFRNITKKFRNILKRH